ncbi:probable DNA polymerase I at C-terminar half [Coccomyxa sp. Obi]|nr:probable DNA polymerase I at C-terminar half [Coccomyxa sp. Obi]
MRKSSLLLKGRLLRTSWNSVVNVLGGPSLAERSTGGPLTSRSFSRPARDLSVQEKELDPMAMRRVHMEERRRVLEEARMREVQPKLAGRANNQHLPAHMTDPDAARRASGAAASSSTSSSIQQSSSARGVQKPALRPPARNGRPGARSSASTAAHALTSPAVPKPPVVAKRDVEKLRGQPGVTYPQEQDPHSDEFQRPVTIPVGGVHNPRTAQETSFSSRTGLSGCQQAWQGSRQVQAELPPEILRNSYVKDIMPEEPHPAAAAVGHGQVGSQEGSSAGFERTAMQKGSSGGGRGAAVGGTASGGGTLGAPVLGSGSSTGNLQPADRSFGAGLASSQNRNKRSVAASAASSDTSQTINFSAVDAEEDYMDSPEAKLINEDNWLRLAQSSEASDNNGNAAAAALQGEPEEDGGEDSAEVSEGDISVVPREVYVVDTVQKAQQAAARLRALHAANPSMFFACDTEVSHIDVAKESPCGHGTVICFSVYCGEDINLGESVDGQPADGITQSQLWVDTMVDDAKDKGTVNAIWEAFRDFFEDESVLKVWHNYSFDRHVLANVWVGGRPIEARGFHADTMHMARLWDSSRRGKGYSLEALSGENVLVPKRLTNGASPSAKTGMKELFAEPKVKKDGTLSKIKELPKMEELQSCPRRRGKWIRYSALDAKATHDLALGLQGQLEALPCWSEHVLLGMDPAVAHATGVGEGYTMWDLYQDYWKPFGKLLTDMEKEGMMVDREHLKAAEAKAVEDQERAKKRFREWVRTKVPDAEYMNICSGPQIRQLLYSGVENMKADKGRLELERTFKAPNVLGRKEEGKKVAKKQMDITIHGLWGPGMASPLKPEVYTPSGWPAVSTPVLRGLAGKPGAAKRALLEIYGVELDTAETAPASSFDDVPLEAVVDDALALEAGEDDDMLDSRDALELDDEAEEGSSTGKAGKGKRKPKAQGKGKAAVSAKENTAPNAAPAQAAADMQSLEYEANTKEAAACGYGKLYAVFGGGREGLHACAAVDALCEVSAVDTLLSNFIRPLQGEAIATVRRDPVTSLPLLDSEGKPLLHRVHCSLNINTETGRLSARRPNLQNQPALEKDRYKVRKAFTAEPGKTLVVADYGQLELRLLAHMANCASMLQAFRLGGDFHSRTALGMYDHIKAAIDRGECLLEWDSVDGSKAPVPLLKDMFGSERRKAKVLNFSIAYGKTAHGLSRDWGTSLEEAKDTVDRWYSDRPEVMHWQKEQRHLAEHEGYVCTILGRRRQLPDARSPNQKAKGHALRAAINTPIQGSAADVATAAMLSIARCPELKEMGWTMLLQVHDEVILEGPKETAERAQQLVVQHMEKPFEGSNPLRVDLVVDSNIADTWYEAK